MVPFDFHPRTRVVFGPGTLAKLGRTARDLGVRRVLLVADQGVVGAGHVARAIAALEADGVEPIPFHDFDQNPDTAMVEAGARFASTLAVDAIVVTAGATHVPSSLLRYLKPGGRMVLPLASFEDNERGVQRLTVFDATPTGMKEQTLDAVRFVPLLPGRA